MSRACLAVLAIALVACNEPSAIDRSDASILDAPPLDDAASPRDAALRTFTFTPSDAPLVNPQRGFFRYSDLATERDFDFVREGGDTLIYSYVHLDDYRDEDLPADFLARLQEGFDAVRDAGISVVLRFAYNEGPWPDSEPDAPLDRVLAHIEQVTPLLTANADVIAVVQAGFIGAWGEWHTSSNGLDTNPEARERITHALLDALPTTRSIQIRNPVYRRMMFGDALTLDEAFTNTYEARAGHHNDCFLSSDSDVGTYPEGELETWLAYLEEDTRYVPVGGETCDVYPARSSCAHAPSEMARLHYTYLNRDYHPDVIASWTTDDCLGAIETHLGYRLELVSAELPETIDATTFPVRVTLRNVGWAAPINPRTPHFVLISGGAIVRDVELADIDARRFFAGETITLEGALDVAGLTPRTYALGLWLPEPSPSLRARPEYAIRTANEGTWDESLGVNVVGAVTVP